MNAPIQATQQEKFNAFAERSLGVPTLAAGEIYAGILLQNGAPAHHLVLLPGEPKPAPWKKAKEWAVQQGGALPTRKEQALLFANAADVFEGDWYWSCEQHASLERFAWYQHFANGSQLSNTTSDELRARAVRRIAI